MKEAFTLIEVLVVLAAVSILSGVGYLAVTGAQTAAKEAKLESDVQTLNRAVQLYISSGGDLTGVTNVDGVIAKLKSRKDAATAARTIGLRENLIDTRITNTPQTAAEATTTQLRAAWDTNSLSFYTRRDGDGWVKEFPLMNTDETIELPADESRAPTLAGATNSTWVWDYSNPGAATGPGNLTPAPGTGPGTPPGSGNGTTTYTTQLAAPSISPGSGSFPAGNFPLQVTITNNLSNPADASMVYYSTGSGFAPYTGPFTVSGGTTVTALAVSLDTTRYQNSAQVSALYELDAPTSLPSGVLLSAVELQNSVQVNGSVTIAGTGLGNITFFGTSRVNGNLYLPGTPDIYRAYVAASQLWSTAADSTFANFIVGNQYSGAGVLVNPPDASWSASPRVINLNGDALPNNYRILIQDSARIDGKIYRRSVPITLPTVTAPPLKSNSVSRDYHSWTLSPSNPSRFPTTVDPTVNSGVNLTTNATLTLLPGNYGNVTGSNNGVLVLGNAANPNVVQNYSFENLNINGGARISIVGKVNITIRFNNQVRVDNNGIFGNPEHPEWLQLRIYSTAAPSANTGQFLLASTGRFYGQILAPTGLVTIQEGSKFVGSVSAYKMLMTGTAGINADVNFSLAPLTE